MLHPQLNATSSQKSMNRWNNRESSKFAPPHFFAFPPPPPFLPANPNFCAFTVHLQKARVLTFFTFADVPAEIDKNIFLKLVPFGQPATFLSLGLSVSGHKTKKVHCLFFCWIFFLFRFDRATVPFFSSFYPFVFSQRRSAVHTRRARPLGRCWSLMRPAERAEASLAQKPSVAQPVKTREGCTCFQWPSLLFVAFFFVFRFAFSSVCIKTRRTYSLRKLLSTLIVLLPFSVRLQLSRPSQKRRQNVARMLPLPVKCQNFPSLPRLPARSVVRPHPFPPLHAFWATELHGTMPLSAINDMMPIAANSKAPSKGWHCSASRIEQHGKEGQKRRSIPLKNNIDSHKSA